MTPRMFCSPGLALALFAGVFAFQQAAQAGLPLICHPLETGGARSLPWGAGRDFNLARADYDLARLADDTLALLTPETPVIARMETLRRATIYAQKDPRIAAELESRLMARALDAAATGDSGALAWFDAGYLAECYKQAPVISEKSPPAPGLNGYAWVSKALALRGNDPDMQFAAALITVYDVSIRGPHKNHEGHLQKAVAGAKDGSLLATNLLAYFGSRGHTLAALRATFSAASR